MRFPAFTKAHGVFGLLLLVTPPAVRKGPFYEIGAGLEDVRSWANFRLSANSGHLEPPIMDRTGFH